MRGAIDLPEPICEGLRYVSWEITRRCDARCVHCYAESGPEAPTGDDLTTAEALDLIDQLAAAGEMIVAFSGGEPLLRPDWRELMQHAQGDSQQPELLDLRYTCFLEPDRIDPRQGLTRDRD